MDRSPPAEPYIPGAGFHPYVLIYAGVILLVEQALEWYMVLQKFGGALATPVEAGRPRIWHLLTNQKSMPSSDDRFDAIYQNWDAVRLEQECFDSCPFRLLRFPLREQWQLEQWILARLLEFHTRLATVDHLLKRW